MRKHCKRKKFSAAPPHTGRPFFGFGNVDALIRDVTHRDYTCINDTYWSLRSASPPPCPTLHEAFLRRKEKFEAKKAYLREQRKQREKKRQEAKREQNDEQT